MDTFSIRLQLTEIEVRSVAQAILSEGEALCSLPACRNLNTS